MMISNVGFIAGRTAENNNCCEAGSGTSPDHLIKWRASAQSHQLSMPLPSSAIAQTQRAKGVYPTLLTSSNLLILLKAYPGSSPSSKRNCHCIPSKFWQNDGLALLRNCPAKSEPHSIIQHAKSKDLKPWFFCSGKAIEDILFSSQIFISYKSLSYQKFVLFLKFIYLFLAHHHLDPWIFCWFYGFIPINLWARHMCYYCYANSRQGKKKSNNLSERRKSEAVTDV